MQPSAASRLLLCGSNAESLQNLSGILEQSGFSVRLDVRNQPEPNDLPAHQLIILDALSGHSESLILCRRIRAALSDTFVPILYLTDAPDSDARLAALNSGADACLPRPFTAPELLAEVRALLRIKTLHDRLTERSAEVNRLNRRLQQAYQQIDDELELAHRIQLSFLPQTMPELPAVRFAIHYRLCGKVGGDFYDVFRLDEHHIGLYVADAMGHGVPASLLTIFIKKGVRTKEINGKQYRLLPPSEVLQRLNKDLIDQALSENPFITMVYALLNCKEGTISFARAGHPYPLHIPAAGPMNLWQIHGSLLGVFDTSFPDSTQRLSVGDKLLFYSDGIDAATFDGKTPGTESLIACAERHRELPIQDFVAALAQDLFGRDNQPDDLTLLGVELLPT